MKRQIIHCCTDAQDRKAGIYGTTWLLNQDLVNSKYVYVQYSVCSPTDQFSRKKGVSFATTSNAVQVHKADLIKYVNSVRSNKSVVFLPTLEDIYQAVIRL